MEEIVPSGVEVVPRLIIFYWFFKCGPVRKVRRFFSHVGGRLGAGRTMDTTSSHLI
jgi:hypothetical protein